SYSRRLRPLRPSTDRRTRKSPSCTSPADARAGSPRPAPRPAPTAFRLAAAMPADDADGARLRALYPLLFCECDLRADLQSVEGPVEDGVPMKIDFPPVRRFDESVIFPGEEVLDAATACLCVMLHLTAEFAHDGFGLAHCSVEGFPNRDQRVCALRRVGMGLVDDNIVMLGHRDAKLDVKHISAPVTGPRPVDDDATTRQTRTEFFQSLHLRSDLGSDLVRRLAVPKDDVDWSLHTHSSRPQSCEMIRL